MYRTIVLIILLSTCWVESRKAQPQSIQVLKDSNLVQLGLYFTPSTLRMLNLGKDPAYDKLIKNVRKMNLWIMSPTFNLDHFYNTTENLTNKEGYEEYIILESTEYELQVLGKPKEERTVGLGNYGDRFYLFHLEGTIDLTKIPEIYERATSADSTAFNGFNYVIDYIKRDEGSRLRREKRQKEWEEKRRKEEEVEKMKQDSLQTIEARDSSG